MVCRDMANPLSPLTILPVWRSQAGVMSMLLCISGAKTERENMAGGTALVDSNANVFHSILRLVSLRAVRVAELLR